MRTRTWRVRGVAVGVVLGWHALVGWWLLQRLPLERGAGVEALQVVYVALPSIVRVGATTARPGRYAIGNAKRRKLTSATATGRPRTDAGADVVAALPGAGTLLVQALDAVRQQAAPEFSRDPFADRPNRLPGAGTDRLRMRPPLTPAAIVEAVSAALFYPPGYEKSPCPRNQRNIANLLASGDSPRLQMELEFERRHCRP